MRPFVLLILSGFLLVTSASCRKTDIIGEKKMEAVLYDLHLADALIEKERQRGLLSDSIRNSLYAATLEKHRITRAQFDSSLSWYGLHLDKYLRIYKSLTARLTEETARYDQILAQEANRIDTVDIWKSKPQLLFINLMFPLIVPFSDSIPGEVKNDDTFTLSFRTFGVNSQMKRFPRVTLSLRYADTTDIKQLTILNDSIYTLTLPVIAEKKPEEVSGYFYVRPHHNNFYRILFDDISLEHISPPIK